MIRRTLKVLQHHGKRLLESLRLVFTKNLWLLPLKRTAPYGPLFYLGSFWQRCRGNQHVAVEKEPSETKGERSGRADPLPGPRASRDLSAFMSSKQTKLWRRLAAAANTQHGSRFSSFPRKFDEDLPLKRC